MRTLQTELVRKELAKQDHQQKLKKQPPSKPISRHEVEELMRTKRPTYHRVRGAFRNK